MGDIVNELPLARLPFHKHLKELKCWLIKGNFEGTQYAIVLMKKVSGKQSFFWKQHQ
jgi:hypothetical protein